MPDEKKSSDTGKPPADEQSGAGYGNNTETDEVGTPGEEEEAAEGHPS